MRAQVAVVIALVACGAKNSAAPTCEQVSAHADELSRKQGDRRWTGAEIMAGVRMRRSCSRLSEAERRCTLASASLAEAAGCLGQEPPEPQDIVAQLTASPKPALVGPFARIALTPELVAKQLPHSYCEHRATIAAWCELREPAFPDVVWRAFRMPRDTAEREWPIGALRITLPGADLRARLANAWGPPREVGEVAYWFDPDAKLRVALRAAQMQGDPASAVDLEYTGYASLADFIGSAKQLFGFERGAPLLGASEAQVRARFGARIEDGHIDLWPVETAPRGARILLGEPLDDEMPDIVRSYTIETALDHDALARALEAKLGAPSQGDGTLVFGDVVLDGTSIVVGDPDAR